MFQASISWMRLLNLYLRQRYDEDHWRRYWVKPHLYPNIRCTYGAFTVAFSYMKEGNHEDFYEIYRMKENQFDELHELLRLKLQRCYVFREPLPSQLRLTVMLQ